MNIGTYEGSKETETETNNIEYKDIDIATDKTDTKEKNIGTDMVQTCEMNVETDRSLNNKSSSLPSHLDKKSMKYENRSLRHEYRNR